MLVQALWAGLWVLSIFLSVIVARLLVGALLDNLSARCEALYFDRETGAWAWLRGVWRSLKELGVQLALLSLHLPVLALLFGVGQIPEVGPWLVAILGWMWTSTWMTLSFIGSVSARHGVSAFGRMGMVVRQKALCWGPGGLCAPVPGLLLPMLLPMLLPGLVCGGTKLFLALAAHEQVPSDLDERARALLLAGRRPTALPAAEGEGAPGLVEKAKGLVAGLRGDEPRPRP